MDKTMKPTPAQARILQALKDGQSIRRILILKTGYVFFYWLPMMGQPRHQLRHKTMITLVKRNWIEYWQDEHGWDLLRITDLGQEAIKA